MCTVTLSVIYLMQRVIALTFHILHSESLHCVCGIWDYSAAVYITQSKESQTCVKRGERAFTLSRIQAVCTGAVLVTRDLCVGWA